MQIPMKKFIIITIIVFLACSAIAQTWNSISVIPGGERLTAVSFSDSLFGMVATSKNKIFVTTDGGYHWTRSYYDSVNPTLELHDIRVFSHTYAIAGGDQGIILTYNGTSWTSNPTGTIKRILSIYMYNESIGYAAGDDGLFIKTIDGGASWIALPGFILKNIQCVSGSGPDHLKAVLGEGWAKAASGIHPWFGYIFTSNDGGLTWSEEILPAHWVNAVAMVNDSSAIFCGTNYVDQTSSNGYPWVRFANGYSSTLYGQGHSIGAISMATPDLGFAVGANPIIKFCLGGMTLQVNPTSHGLNDVAAIADTLSTKDYSEKHLNAWAVGDSGTVLKYSETIVAIREPGSEPDFSGFVYPNPTTGIVHVMIPKEYRNVNVTITNLTGKSILSRNVSAPGLITLDISGFPDGLYFTKLKVEYRDKSYYRYAKIVKHR